MIQTLLSILVNALLSLSFLVRDDMDAGFRQGATLVCLGFVAVSLIGLLGFWATRKKVFACVAIAGFVAFVPIGLIGIFGIKKLMKARAEEPAEGLAA